MAMSVVVACTILPEGFGQVVARSRPAEWDGLVYGGQFKDLFEPMPVRQTLTSHTWGGENVTPRDVSNGIEDPDWAYWCGDPYRDENGLSHLYTARWPESHKNGHMGYFDSRVVHAVAEDPLGPYRVVGDVGWGHNPDLYQSRPGEYVIYCTRSAFYRSKSLFGPWKPDAYNFDNRERYYFPRYVNFSPISRDDGSMIAVSRHGYMWVSRDGLRDWYEVSEESVYPKVDGNFEDPVMWKDDVQYHIIVNDWKGRIAYYLRSLDGFRWVAEPGEAYGPGISRYEDGTVNDWYKYERLRFLQDEHGRPTHAHFAVIDCDKHSDKANDNHNSKMIIMPMTVARLLEIQNADSVSTGTNDIRVKIKAEDDFDPHTDIDLASLRFGASSEVNYGRGAQLLKTEKAGKDLMLVFAGRDCGFSAENFACKLMGRSKGDKLLFGWARLPGKEHLVAHLSALSPTFEYTDRGMDAFVEVKNFGEVFSDPSVAKIIVRENGKEVEIGTQQIRPLDPFEKTVIRIDCNEKFAPDSQHDITVLLVSPDVKPVAFTKNFRF